MSNHMNEISEQAKKEIQSITKLTKEQEEKIPNFIEKWRNKIKNSDPCNRKEAERLIKIIYEQGGYKFPEVVKWYDSPMTLVKENNIKNLDFCYGAMESWNAFYDFFISEFNLECCEPIKPFLELADNIGWWIPMDDIVLCSEKPSIVSIKDGRLHNDTGAAVAWKDGYAQYYVNGISMIESDVVTPGHLLPVERIIKETNAEVRRELVRKIGVERMCIELNAECVDKKSYTIQLPVCKENPEAYEASSEVEYEEQETQYELLMLDIGDDRKRPYLKMINPSLGLFHIEGVSPECQTVDQALEFRNGTKKLPIRLS